MKDNVVRFRRRLQSLDPGKPTSGSRSSGWFSPIVGGLVALIVLGVAGLGYFLMNSPWPVDVTLRHWLAAPNCTTARFVLLAPAQRGAPGYYSQHDADHDGTACEPWPGSGDAV